jgi:hypothetical protein
MRRFYPLLLICSCLALAGNAQRQKLKWTAKPVAPLPGKMQPATPGTVTPGTVSSCDTVNQPIPDYWNLVDYLLLEDGGFLSGTNVFGDQEKANYFDLTGQTYSYLTGAYVYFGSANSATPADLLNLVNFKVYSATGGAPGAQIGSIVSIPLSSIKTDVDANNPTLVTFPSPIALPTSKQFFVSVDISNFSWGNLDSVSVVSTSDTDHFTPGTGTAWEKFGDGTWHNFNDSFSWGFDAALAIFPFVSESATGCNLLPVDLLSFASEKTNNNKDVLLTWKVAQEMNMKGYEVQKANNDNRFEDIQFVAARNDFKAQSYSYTDANAFSRSTDVQYRLKQIDNDGTIKYSTITTARSTSALNNLVFANPFNGTLKFNLNLSSATTVGIGLFDMNGRQVAVQQPKQIVSGISSITLNSTTSLQSGVYLLRINIGDQEYKYKVIKQ